jgi:hypothetical protein
VKYSLNLLITETFEPVFGRAHCEREVSLNDLAGELQAIWYHMKSAKRVPIRSIHGVATPQTDLI